jgi:hypothetical protein
MTASVKILSGTIRHMYGVVTDEDPVVSEKEGVVIGEKKYLDIITKFKFYRNK